MSLTLGLAFTLATALFVIAGDVVIKTAADAARFTSPNMMAGVLLYALSAVCWYFAMRNITLGQGAVAYSMLTLIAVVLIGAIWFGEALGTRQILGLMAAATAMLLMAETA